MVLSRLLPSSVGEDVPFDRQCFRLFASGCPVRSWRGTRHALLLATLLCNLCVDSWALPVCRLGRRFSVACALFGGGGVGSPSSPCARIPRRAFALSWRLGAILLCMLFEGVSCLLVC